VERFDQEAVTRKTYNSAGQVLNSDQVYELFEGLESNDLAHYSHLLTGYVNAPATLRKIMDIHDKLKQNNPSLFYGKLS
jgi:pyridoxine kinase